MTVGVVSRVQIGAITSAFGSPALKATSGMLLARVHARIAVRNRLPICSNTAGDVTGLPRWSCGKYTPARALQRGHEPDQVDRSRHEMPNVT